MKTVVIGLFHESDAAQRVLAQLARSPLDLDTVAVVHADPEVQRRMATEAGLPERRAVLVGLVIGALLGGTLGAWLGTDVLSAIGPLLAAATGVVAGGALGTLFSALNESLRLPPEHAVALSEAVDEGATVLLVRSASLPTSRAIRDLFVAGGAAPMPSDLPSELQPELPPEMLPRMPPRPSGLLVPVLERPDDAIDASTEAGGEGATSAATGVRRPPRDEHTMFAPPWRRTPASVRVPPGVSAVMDAETDAQTDEEMDPQTDAQTAAEMGAQSYAPTDAESDAETDTQTDPPPDDESPPAEIDPADRDPSDPIEP